MNAASIRSLLAAQADPARAEQSRRFFKTGPGQYAEGDLFWGLTAAQVRIAALFGRDLPLSELEILLEDAIHEARSCALLILTAQFRKANEDGRRAIVDFYLRRTDRINNWDLVDTSACILGQWLTDKPRALLYQLADSSCLWEQRIAVVATHVFIKRGDFTDILALSEKLLRHPHDLIHKALGWMLREVGKQDKAALEAFLSRRANDLPRTTLRYALERFPSAERSMWMKTGLRPGPRREDGAFQP